MKGLIISLIVIIGGFVLFIAGPAALHPGAYSPIFRAHYLETGRHWESPFLNSCRAKVFWHDPMTNMCGAANCGVPNRTNELDNVCRYVNSESRSPENDKLYIKNHGEIDSTDCPVCIPKLR